MTSRNTIMLQFYKNPVPPTAGRDPIAEKAVCNSYVKYRAKVDRSEMNFVADFFNVLYL